MIQRPPMPSRDIRCPMCGVITIRLRAHQAMAMPDPTCRKCRYRRDESRSIMHAADKIRKAADTVDVGIAIQGLLDSVAIRALVELEIALERDDERLRDLVRNRRRAIEESRS